MGDFDRPDPATPDTYPEVLKKFRQRRNESEVLFPLMNRIKSELDLESAETCLSIGTGPGENDIQFIQRCLPNLKKFIAVEQNEYCATQLDSNFQSALPHLKRTIHQETIETWKGPEVPVDVVLIFHMLYGLKKIDRQNLVEKCFKSWLKPQTGVIVVIHMSDDNMEKANVLQMIYREMEGWNLLLEAKELKEEIRSLNLIIEPEYKYECNMDLRNLDAKTLNWLHACETNDFNEETHNLNAETIEKMLKKIAPNGFGKYIAELFVVKKIPS